MRVGGRREKEGGVGGKRQVEEGEIEKGERVIITLKIHANPRYMPTVLTIYPPFLISFHNACFSARYDSIKTYPPVGHVFQ